jgi:DNA ligase 4
VNQLNKSLDDLVNKNDQKIVFTDLINMTNASEFKWIIRIILKDLKLNIKNDVVLNAFHPDAVEFNNLNNNL